jgi:4-hydroxy-4-methyl-2-oxoglutarate aldolase
MERRIQYMENLDETLNAEIERKLSGIIPLNRIHTFDFPRPSKDIIDRYLQIEDVTSALSDIMDEKGIRGAIPASILQPIIPGKRIAGPAITFKHIPQRKTVTQQIIDKERSKHGGTRDAREIAKPGDVIVYDGGGRMDVSSQGYIAALFSKAKGLAATILDCGARDIEGIRKIDYPTWARGITPITGRHRFESYEINCPIVCAGILVCPGDLIVADDSGIVIIPSSLIEEVLVILEKVNEKEQELKRAIRRGVTIEEAIKILPSDKW